MTVSPPLFSSPLPSGSGDLLADRRFGYGEALAAEGDHAAAADLFAQTAELVPHWAPAWLSLGRSLAKTGQRDEAGHAFDKAVALDPDGHLGAALDQARHRGLPPPAMPPRFVAALFDRYADRFDDHLAALGYRGPTVILDALARAAPSDNYGDVLDLGCGTGLMAAAIGTRAGSIDGVDLSPRMLDRARATGLYRHLVAASLSDFLAASPAAGYDCAVAADVFVYVGALDALMTGVARALRPRGLFAFTVQRADDPADFTLGADMRFSHSRAYVEQAVTAAGLHLCEIAEQSTRRDGGIDVPGLVVVASRS